MSDYRRTFEAVTVTLYDTRNAETVGDAAHIITPAVLGMLADEAEHWSRQFQLPPIAAEWPQDEQLNLTLREAYVAGFHAASETLAARAAALRLAERQDMEPEPQREDVTDTPAR